MKTLLSFLLARSVWQFYHSDWMKDGWSKETVHFMLEHRPPISRVIFINEPFLRARFKRPLVDQTTPKPERPMFTTHMYPKVLALGVMLLEVELGRPIEEFRSPDSHNLDETNALHLAACNALNDETVWPPAAAFTDIKNVIEICITPDIDRLGTNQKEVRHQLYQHVVAILEGFFQRAWEHTPDKCKVDPITPDKPRTAPTASPGPFLDLNPPIAPFARTNCSQDQSPGKSRDTSFGINHPYLSYVGPQQDSFRYLTIVAIDQLSHCPCLEVQWLRAGKRLSVQ
jgi:hypothetical protein